MLPSFSVDRLRRMRIPMPAGLSARLAFLVGTGVVSLLVVGAAGWVGTHLLQSANRQLIEGEIAQVVRMAELGQSLAKMRQAEKDIVIEVTDVRRVEEFSVRWETAFKEVDFVIAEAQKAEINADNRERLAQMGDRAKAYATSFRQFSQRAKAGEFKDSLDAMDATALFKKPIDEAESLAKNQLDTERVNAKEKGDGLARTALVTEIVIGAVALLSTIITVFLGLVIVRAVRRRVDLAIRTAQSIASGDLTQNVKIEGRDEITQLLQAIADMQAALSRVVSDVRSSSESIHTASAEIAAGNHDLSSRTENQASSLQHTSSTVMQLTDTVQHNSSNTAQAQSLVIEATKVAERGGQVVAGVVQTMGAISASSKKIADIISAIDGIAFQTNILALNAAVEAARAGEQGRGFAVVAGEVRTLAQRSAEAAKEIKSLIGDSVDKVESGTKLVANAGTTMNEIVASVKRVADIMSEINAATKEQATGIAQVNRSVTEIDQATQQNAALVEESAAAASSLKDQAQRLTDAVRVFKLHAA
jgi:methyl-accepting chemotaxis protein